MKSSTVKASRGHSDTAKLPTHGANMFSVFTALINLFQLLIATQLASGSPKISLPDGKVCSGFVVGIRGVLLLEDSMDNAHGLSTERISPL